MERDMGFTTIRYVLQQSLRPVCAYAQSDRSPCKSLKYSVTVKSLYFGLISLKRGCTGASEFLKKTCVIALIKSPLLRLFNVFAAFFF